MELLPQQANGSVRQRKQNVGSIVQEFDAFNKVVDDVKEEPKAVNGFLSVICFSLIIVLLVGLLYEYFTNTEVEYKFAVDTDFAENLFFELDLQVATPAITWPLCLWELTERQQAPRKAPMNT
uniref:Endoplasmic reticulum vesicle transporter N-terminal domain-containing protein n=1 Tax=Ditylenchus dipsaci TaxID=166011 RepID=A0A915E7D0_9BILA